ncbi:hypothetical protein NHX12_024613, partial [Muraenolepis orangiensis]
WVGSPCGSHGPYVFYKAFRFQPPAAAGRRLLSLGDFVLVRCGPAEPVCVAELQLLWEERTSKRLLSSSKLYFLPEDTPSGRTVTHGEDEVIAVSEKVVVGLEELVQWTAWDPEAPSRDVDPAEKDPPPCLHHHHSTLSSGLKFRDILKEKAERGGVLVRSYLQYCRYRAVLSRLRGGRPSSLLQEQLLLALGGISSASSSSPSSPEEDLPRVLYCRDTFQHPTLRSNQSVCHDFAPNLKGRPRKKKPSVCLRPDLQGQSQFKVDAVALSKPKCSNSGTSSSNEEQGFLVSLYKYMKERKTPIQRIPYLGFKQINLWTMFQAAQKLGGYELITARRQWKQVYDDLGGNPGSTSAATCTRRHYERLILPYERFSKGDEDRPLPSLGAKKHKADPAAAQVSSGDPKLQLTIGVPPGEEDSATEPQETSTTESSEEALRLNLEPQVLVASSKPSHRRGQRKNRDDEDEGSAREIQLTLKEETRGTTERNRRRRRSSRNLHDGDRSHLETCGKIENAALLQSPTPKDLGHCHVALEVWKADSLDPCHAGMASPALEHRESPLQSALTISGPDSERADRPQKEDMFMGFTFSPELHSGIMSPLAKKKLTSQVSRTESPDHKDHFRSSFPAPAPLVSSGLTGVGEAAVLPLRPSVIQHVYSYRAREEEAEKKKDGVESKSTRDAEDFGAPPEDTIHQRLSPTSPTPGAPQMPRRAGTPPGLFGDHCFSSHIYNPYGKRTSGPLLIGQVQGAPALIQSETHSADSCFIFPRKSVKTQSQGSTLKQQLQWRDTSFTNELSHSVSKLRQWHQGSSLPKDAENFAHSPLVPCSGPDSSPISLTGMKDSMSADGDDSGTSEATDEQPTDLSLPKSSSRKQFTETSFLEPLSCPSVPHQDDSKLSAATSHSLSQNRHRIPSITYHPRPCRVPPMSVCDMNTHSPMNSRLRAAETIADGHMDAGRRDGLEKTESGGGVGGGQYGRPNEAMDVYNKTGEQTCTLSPILESARPLKRQMERIAQNCSSERKIRAVSPMHTTSLFASSTSSSSPLRSTTLSPLYTVAALCEQRKSQMFGEMCNGSTRPVAISKSQETSPRVPRDFLEGDLSGALSLAQLSDLCGEHLGSPSFAGCPPSTLHSLPHHTLEYWKNHSASVLSPFAVHSFMMQRQLLAQAAASPVQMTYRHPLAAASYGGLLHHRLYPVSISSQPAYSPPQLNSVHPSTKLS